MALEPPLTAFRAQADVEYLTDALLAALSVDLVLFQRRDVGLSLDALKDGWETLVVAVLS